VTSVLATAQIQTPVFKQENQYRSPSEFASARKRRSIAFCYTIFFTADPEKYRRHERFRAGSGISVENRKEPRHEKPGADVSNSADGRSVTSKLAAILHTFSSGSVFSLSEIARAAGLPVSTAHRLANELSTWGFLERTDDKQYRVGTLMRLVGSQEWHEPDLYEHGRRVLDDLATATRCTVRLGTLNDLAVSYIERQHDVQTVATSQTRVLPAHATAMGKALLAFSPPETVSEVIENGLDQYTPFTIITAHGLRRALAIARMTRVATTRQELRLNTAAVGVPVFAGGGQVVAAFELTMRNSGYQIHLIQSAVVVAARSLTHEIINSHCRRQLNRSLVYLRSG
jgi:DNA-binding IclR family transcriptional regulator